MNILQSNLGAKVCLRLLLPVEPTKLSFERTLKQFAIRVSRLKSFTSNSFLPRSNLGLNLKKPTDISYRSIQNAVVYSKHLLKLSSCNSGSTCLSFQIYRLFSRSAPQNASISGMTLVNYLLSLLVFMVGMAYAAVPLYRIFCAKTGTGGDPRLAGENMTGKIEDMKPVRERKITVTFNADHHSEMEWDFKPSQKKVTVIPGETALAFYTAKNPTDQPIIGIATYNILPFQAGLYFNKIQCFCFEEQWLNPNEEVDMPVFFFIDPEYDDDPVLADTDDIILSYTFFRSSEGMTLPLPGFMSENATTAAS